MNTEKDNTLTSSIDALSKVLNEIDQVALYLNPEDSAKLCKTIETTRKVLDEQLTLAKTPNGPKRLADPDIEAYEERLGRATECFIR